MIPCEAYYEMQFTKICKISSKSWFYERIEYDIASHKNSVDNHFSKWENILNSLSYGIPL